jgi:hypothetical protein
LRLSLGSSEIPPPIDFYIRWPPDKNGRFVGLFVIKVKANHHIDTPLRI